MVSASTARRSRRTDLDEAVLREINGGIQSSLTSLDLLISSSQAQSET
jgi:hypothetical protein